MLSQHQSRELCITRPSIYIGRGAVDRLQAYLAEHNLRRTALVADANTYAALGGRVEAALRGAGLDVLTILLAGPEIIVDEAQVIDVMLRNDAGERAFLAVGSGTVTDIARFVTLQTGGAFISLPTAPSVDGYTSPITPMVVKRLKITAPGHLPQAIFADLDTLRAAPRPDDRRRRGGRHRQVDLHRRLEAGPAAVGRPL